MKWFANQRSCERSTKARSHFDRAPDTDSETGLQYLEARYYDPRTGQFITRDPLEIITGQPYNYAADDPTNLIDPTGQSVCLFGYCLGWHPVNPLKAIANFGAGFANASTSTLTGGAITIGQPFCGTSLNISYGIGGITAGAEAGVATGVGAEAGLVKRGAGPLWSPIAAGLTSGGFQTLVTHGGNVTAVQISAGVLGGGIGGVGGNVAGSMVFTPSRAAVAGAGGLASSFGASALLPW